MAETLFNDSYEGPRFRYALTLRPLAPFTVPDGYIIFSDLPHADYPHGTIDYPRSLTRSEQDRFSLVEVCRVYPDYEGSTGSGYTSTDHGDYRVIVYNDGQTHYKAIPHDDLTPCRWGVVYPREDGSARVALMLPGQSAVAPTRDYVAPDLGAAWDDAIRWVKERDADAP